MFTKLWHKLTNHHRSNPTQSVRQTSKELGVPKSTVFHHQLKYKELVERGLQERASSELKELEVVLGLDETWLDKMLLVCQELSSGYLFFVYEEID